jgi:hypothetical protein
VLYQPIHSRKWAAERVLAKNRRTKARLRLRTTGRGANACELQEDGGAFGTAKGLRLLPA